MSDTMNVEAQDEPGSWEETDEHDIDDAATELLVEEVSIDGMCGVY